MLAVLAVLASAATAASSGAAEPQLRIAARAPLVLAGEGFAAREAVRLRVNAGGSVTTRRLRATSRGDFRAAFTGIRVERCGDALLARAFGARGSRAVLRLPPRLCPEPIEAP